ncbi:MAG: hypothetical protein IKO79_03040 [Butyrivibrio sp.]|nr:hypothetical protein [Butyrivibrio sp.]
MNDSISRQAAIEALAAMPCKTDEDGYVWIVRFDAWARIDTLPPAEPHRMRAKWIATTSLQEGQITWRDYKCSNCSHHREKPMNFCEVCGAKMER